MLGQYLANALRPKGDTGPTLVSSYRANPFGNAMELARQSEDAQARLMQALASGPSLEPVPEFRPPAFGLKEGAAALLLELLNQSLNRGRDPGAGLAGIVGGMNQRAGLEHQNALARTQQANQQAMMRDERMLKGLELHLSGADRRLSRALDFDENTETLARQEKRDEIDRQEREKQWNYQLGKDKEAAKRYEDSLRAKGMQDAADQLKDLMKSLEAQTKEGAVEIVKELVAELEMPPQKAEGYIRQAEINRDQAERKIKAQESASVANNTRLQGNEQWNRAMELSKTYKIPLDEAMSIAEQTQGMVGGKGNAPLNPLAGLAPKDDAQKAEATATQLRNYKSQIETASNSYQAIKKKVLAAAKAMMSFGAGTSDYLEHAKAYDELMDKLDGEKRKWAQAKRDFDRANGKNVPSNAYENMTPGEPEKKKPALSGNIGSKQPASSKAAAYQKKYKY